MSEVSGYITAVYDQKWWLAYVLEKNEEEDELKAVSYTHLDVYKRQLLY